MWGSNSDIIFYEFSLFFIFIIVIFISVIFWIGFMNFMLIYVKKH